MTGKVKNNIHRAGLLLGSNLGNKEFNIERAKELISESAGKIIKVSSVYETHAWGKQDQPVFYNLAIVIETYLSPNQLLKEILEIEKKMGRIRKEKWGPRIIDIDILFFDESIINLPELKIPHPHLHQRKFALIPLAEIEPGWLHPQLEKDIDTLIAGCDDTLAVKVAK